MIFSTPCFIRIKFINGVWAKLQVSFLHYAIVAYIQLPIKYSISILLLHVKINDFVRERETTDFISMLLHIDVGTNTQNLMSISPMCAIRQV